MERREVWVAGFPGFWGGADTELDHQLDLLIACGVTVHLVPMFAADPAMRASAMSRGCLVHDYRDDIFVDKTVVSFCNKNFMPSLPAIMKAGPPARVVWFNCMTWLVAGTLQAHEKGWIDYFGFVSDYQRECLAPLLSRVRPFRTFGYMPHFNLDRVPWRYRDWEAAGSYHVGRVSRDDRSKYATDTWQIFERVGVPIGVTKRAYVLGFGPTALEAIGPPPPTLEAYTWPCNSMPTDRFFRLLDTMIHKTGTSRESYCRALVEAYAYGVVPIVEDDYAFPELVIDGETGFMTSDSEEMSTLASDLAHDPHLHRRLAENGRRHLKERLIDPERTWRGWLEVL